MWSDMPTIKHLVSGRSGTRSPILWFLAQCSFHYTLIILFPLSFFSPGSTSWLQVKTALNCDPITVTAQSNALSSRHLASSADTWLSPNSSSIFHSEPSVSIKPPSFSPALTPSITSHLELHWIYHHVEPESGPLSQYAWDNSHPGSVIASSPHSSLHPTSCSASEAPKEISHGQRRCELEGP